MRDVDPEGIENRSVKKKTEEEDNLLCRMLQGGCSQLIGIIN